MTQPVTGAPCACLLAVACWLQGCAGTPPASIEPPQEPAPPQAVLPQVIVVPAGPNDWELRQRARAIEHEQKGRLAEAALVWETLATVYPRAPVYRDRLAELRLRTAREAAERIGRAEQAAARGHRAAAVAHYLSALALQPDHQGAADALRMLERDYNRLHHLGKLSRHALTRQAIADSMMSPEPSSTAAADAATPLPAARAASAAGAGRDLPARR